MKMSRQKVQQVLQKLESRLPKLEAEANLWLQRLGASLPHLQPEEVKLSTNYREFLKAKQTVEETRGKIDRLRQALTKG